jgi:hypothetical protein
MWEILSKKNIIELWLRSGGSNTRVAYAMSILLGRGIVERVASGVYIVQNETKNIEMWKYYWQIIAKLIDVHSPSGGVIGWEKALELHLSNYSTPDILIIYTRDTALRIKLTDGREVHMRTLVSGPKTGKKNLWRTLADNAIEANPPTHFNRGGWNWIQICGRELALLEALSLRRHDAGVEEANIARFLRSFGTQIDRETLGDLTRLRYIRPLNRLRVLARDLGYTGIYAMTLEIIQDEGGWCYLNL